MQRTTTWADVVRRGRGPVPRHVLLDRLPADLLDAVTDYLRLDELAADVSCVDVRLRSRLHGSTRRRPGGCECTDVSVLNGISSIGAYVRARQAWRRLLAWRWRSDNGVTVAGGRPQPLDLFPPCVSARRLVLDTRHYSLEGSGRDGPLHCLLLGAAPLCALLFLCQRDSSFELRLLDLARGVVLRPSKGRAAWAVDRLHEAVQACDGCTLVAHDGRAIDLATGRLLASLPERGNGEMVGVFCEPDTNDLVVLRAEESSSWLERWTFRDRSGVARRSWKASTTGGLGAHGLVRGSRRLLVRRRARQLHRGLFVRRKGTPPAFSLSHISRRQHQADEGRPPEQAPPPPRKFGSTWNGRTLALGGGWLVVARDLDGPKCQCELLIINLRG